MAANRQTDRQTDRQTYIHTQVRNAVMLVWGSLRLAPKTHLQKCVICMFGKRFNE